MEEGSLAVGEQGGRGATDLVPGLYSLGDPSKASLALIFFGGGVGGFGFPICARTAELRPGPHRLLSYPSRILDRIVGARGISPAWSIIELNYSHL